MTVLAQTESHLVEFEFGVLTIARYSDGHCLMLKGRGIAGHFRDCLKTHSPQRVTETFIRMCRGQEWQPLYKPHRMPRELEKVTR